MYRNVYAFYGQMLLYWQFHSEMEVCKVEQHSYVKVAVVCSGNAWVCQVELRETLGDHPLLYCTIARLAQAANI